MIDFECLLSVNGLVSTFQQLLYIYMGQRGFLTILPVCVPEPVCGPNVSVLVHEDRRIQIQWEELAVYQQRGFITNYTVYLQTLDSNHTEHRGEGI